MSFPTLSNLLALSHWLKPKPVSKGITDASWAQHPEAQNRVGKDGEGISFQDVSLTMVFHTLENLENVNV